MKVKQHHGESPSSFVALFNTDMVIQCTIGNKEVIARQFLVKRSRARAASLCAKNRMLTGV